MNSRKSRACSFRDRSPSSPQWRKVALRPGGDRVCKSPHYLALLYQEIFIKRERTAEKYSKKS